MSYGLGCVSIVIVGPSRLNFVDLPVPIFSPWDCIEFMRCAAGSRRVQWLAAVDPFDTRPGSHPVSSRKSTANVDVDNREEGKILERFSVPLLLNLTLNLETIEKLGSRSRYLTIIGFVTASDVANYAPFLF